MTDEERRQARILLDDLYIKLAGLAMETICVERRINELLEELGEEI